MGWDGRSEEAEEGSQPFRHTSLTRSRGQARGGTFCRRERRRRPRHDTLELRGVAGSGRAAERADGLLAAAGGPRMRYAVVPACPPNATKTLHCTGSPGCRAALTHL